MVETALIQGVHMGPPCSTCSHARHNPPFFPSQIRSKAFPLGLPRKELSQAKDMEAKNANYLYVQCFRMGVLCQRRNIPFAIEFPSQLSEDHVTLADFPQGTALLSLEGVRLVKLYQCRFGATTTKPTTLLCLGKGWDALALECNHPWVRT